MTIKNFKELNLFDENEQIVVMNGDVNYPNRIYTGNLWSIPNNILELEVWQICSMGERRRKMWNLNKYGWIEIWID